MISQPYRSVSRRVCASIVLLVGWNLAMYVSPWGAHLGHFASGTWGTDTSGLMISDLWLLLTASALSVAVAWFVGYLTVLHVLVTLLAFWSFPMMIDYFLGVFLSQFGPGGGASTPLSRLATIAYFAVGPFFAAAVAAGLNKWRGIR